MSQSIASDEAVDSSLPRQDRPEDRAAQEEPTRSVPIAGSLTWVRRSLPANLVFVALALLGYAGHQSGWKIPKFSEFVGGAPEIQAAWCEEHRVPEDECIACNAQLMPKLALHGWCKEHGVHECVLHHPELAQLKETPDILRADLDRAARAIGLRPRVKNDPACKMHLRRIQFASIAAVDKAGIDIDLVGRGPVVESISATGEITYDQTRVARLSTRVPGTVWRVEKAVGDRVKQGEVLALVDAAEVGQAKAKLLQALVNLDYQHDTYETIAKLREGVIARRRIRESETALREASVRVQTAKQALVNLGLPVAVENLQAVPADKLAAQIQFLGLPESITSYLDPERTTANLIPVTAPFDGVVVALQIVAGEVVDSSKSLFTVADINQMWLTLNVRLEDAQYINLGQAVSFRPDGSDADAEGMISWISTAVDQQSRTVKVRANLSNADGRLRDETFGMGSIILRDESDAVVVAKEAIHQEGCCHVAFVRDKNYFKDGSYKVFHTRSVRPGVTNGRYTEVIAGLLPGEVVVTKGSGALRAELLKGNLGAG